MHVNIIEGDFAPLQDARFALVAARFNCFIVQNLINGAVDTLHRHGIPETNIDLIWTPGSFELPLAAQRLAASERYDGIVALGAIIRGGTPHFEYVASPAFRIRRQRVCQGTGWRLIRV